MKKEDVLISLSRILSDVICFDGFVEELRDLIAKSGKELLVFTLLIGRLSTLASEGVSVTRYKEFENISNGIYSMHLAGTGFNIRILFGFLPNRMPVLLLPFYERGKKKATDYSRHLPTAIERLRIKKEEYNRE